MKELTKEDILNFPETSYGRALGKQKANQVVSELLQYKILQEHYNIKSIENLESMLKVYYTSLIKLSSEFSNLEVIKRIAKSYYVGNTTAEESMTKILEVLMDEKDI